MRCKQDIGLGVRRVPRVESYRRIRGGHFENAYDSLPLNLRVYGLDVSCAIEQANRFQTVNPHRCCTDKSSTELLVASHRSKDVEKTAKADLCSATNLHVMGTSTTRSKFF
jgi:hypothetical protein